MHPKASASTALAATLFAATATAAPPVPDASLFAETDRVAYYALGDSKIDVEKTEGYLNEAEKALGHRFQGQAKYYGYEDTPHLAAVTGRWVSGLTILNSGVIHTTPSAGAHEIVHLVSGQIGNPGSFFTEGLAVALTAKGRWGGKKLRKIAKRATQSVPFVAFVSRFTTLSADVAYPVAGAFVESLIKKHGLAKVVQLFRAVGAGDDTNEAFEALFGQSLSEAGSKWIVSL